MLWEDADPTHALPARFGLADLPAATSWLTAVLAEDWGLRIFGCDRWVISATNAIAWVTTGDGPLVVKVAADEPTFERLAAIATLLGDLDAPGLPVAAPLPARSSARRVVRRSDRALSVAVLPLVEGVHLDVADLAAVRATGTLVARLHLALAEVDPAPFGPGRLDRLTPDEHRRAAWLHGLPAGRAPRAHARLTDLLTTLPPPAPPRQLVHGDVRGANVLVRDGRVAALLDFDELGLGSPTAELATAAVLLATQFRRWPPAPPAAQHALLAGYEDVLPLDDAERGWWTATRLRVGLGQIPTGADPHGWADAVDAWAHDPAG